MSILVLKLNNLTQIEIIDPPSNHRHFLENEYYYLNKQKNASINPDVRITFKPDLEMKDSAVIVSSPVGYDSHGVFFFDLQNRISRIDFSNFSKSTIEIIVDKQFNARFLSIIIEYLLSNLLLAKNGCFCHASAIKYKGKVFLFPAWRHVGKTNLLLSFLKDGAEVIADDGVFLFKDGTILPYSKCIHLLYYNFKEFPHLMDKVDKSTLSLFKFVSNAKQGIYNIDKGLIEELQKKITRRFLFSDISNIQHIPQEEKIDYVFYLRKRNTFDINSLKINLVFPSYEELAIKATEACIYEQNYFYLAYQTFCFITGTRIELLDNYRKKIEYIHNNVFKNVIKTGELVFDNFIEHKNAKQLIKNFLINNY